MSEISKVSSNTLLWDSNLTYQLPSRIARKMGQTPLSRISYHRAMARKSGRIRLSQAIGILVWLNRYDLLTDKGSERMLFLQSKASFEAIEAGISFAKKLDSSEKLVMDFYHHLVDQNTRPSSIRLRKFRAKNRIGVGYRDKGALPSQSAYERRKSEEESWIFEEDIATIISIIALNPPPDLKEGEWVDLPGYVRFLRENHLSQEKVDLLLTLL